MIDTIRRVVAGERGRGTDAMFTHVEEVDPLTVGPSKLYWIWGWDERPTLPYSETNPYRPYSMFPPTPDGLRVTGLVMPPQAPTGGWVADKEPGNTVPQQENANEQERRRFIQAVPHGRLQGSKPTMHRTDTIDFGLVLSGEVVVELEGGDEQTLRPGDVYIQHGAMHAWRNDGSEPALVIFINLPAQRSD